jgi:hypothetical protein
LTLQIYGYFSNHQIFFNIYFMIFDFLYEKSGFLNKNKLRESWFKTNKIKEYSDIINFIKNNKLFLEKFSKKVYHYENNLKNIPICTHCNQNNCRFIGYSTGYDPCTKPKAIELRKQNTLLNME